MKTPSRRTFFKAAGVSAVAAGAAVASTSTASAAVQAPLRLPAAARGSMMVHIQDVATGELSVMVEGREVTVTDRQLVAKLAHVLHSQAV